MEEKYFTKEDIKKIFAVEKVPEICFDGINEERIKYFVLNGRDEKEGAILRQLKRIKGDKKR